MKKKLTYPAKGNSFIEEIKYLEKKKEKIISEINSMFNDYMFTLKNYRQIESKQVKK